MSISWPLSMPTLPEAGGIASVTIIGEFAQGRNTNAFNNTEQVYDYVGERWALSVAYSNLSILNARAVMAFLLSLRGYVGTFMAGDLLMASPQSSIPGAPKVNGSGQTGRTLAVKGLTPSVSNAIHAGDYFQIGNYLYCALENANSDGSGNTNVEIFPFIRGTPSDGADLTFTSPKNIFRLNDASVSWSADVNKYYKIAFTAVEARS